jgi:hypothetical protein
VKQWILKNRNDLILIWLIALNLGFISALTPTTVWNTEPATGGDTGSHFYPLYTLAKVALPNFQLRTWNPGNLMGEPHLLHYFPTPYLIMAFLSFLIGLGLAFNLGILLPLFSFPLVVYYCLRGLGFRKLTSVFLSTFSLLHLFNESYSMWGGNSSSLLAGQFAHLYAVNFLLLWIGAQARVLNKGTQSLWPALLIVATLTSHPYIALLVPFFCFSFMYLHRSQWKSLLIYFLKLGGFSLLLSLWFLVPMILNAPWTTGNPMDWIFGNFWNEAIPNNYRAMLIIFVMTLPFLTYQAGAKKLKLDRILSPLLFWGLPALACVGMFFIFPKLGLVDARVIPQIQLFFTIAIGLLLMEALSATSWFVHAALALAISVSGLIFLKNSVKNYPHWIRWNYSSWKAKPKWPNAREVFDFVQGDFSQTRIAGEHHPSLNDTGTTRVWEMAPYFAKRATMESLYQEAAFTAPLTHYLQARISTNPSCPIRGYPCPSMNFEGLENWLSVLGVEHLILSTDATREAAQKNPAFKTSLSSGPFTIMSLVKTPKMVELVTRPPQLTSAKFWKRDFYTWNTEFDMNRPQLVIDPELQDRHEIIATAEDTVACNPTVRADYNWIELTTNCPGKLHWLKYTYHPTFKADSGDPIYLIAPGHMALIPSQERVLLRFGQSWAWTISAWISFLALLGFLWLNFLRRCQKTKH